MFFRLPRYPFFYLSESHNYAPKDAYDRRMLIVASSDKCRTQICRCRGRPWYTFQGHIERGWEDSCPEAYLLWKNMLRHWALIP